MIVHRLALYTKKTENNFSNPSNQWGYVDFPEGDRGCIDF